MVDSRVKRLGGTVVLINFRTDINDGSEEYSNRVGSIRSKYVIVRENERLCREN